MATLPDILLFCEATPGVYTLIPAPAGKLFLASAYGGLALAGTPWPYLQVTDTGEGEPEYFGASDANEASLEGRSLFAYPTFQLSLFAEGFDAADDLGESIKEIFDKAVIPLTDGTHLATYRELFVLRQESVRSSNQIDIWQCVIQYRLRVQEATTAGAGAPQLDQLVVVTQPPATVTVGTAFGLVVQVNDSQGSLDTDFNGPVSITLTSPGTLFLIIGNSFLFSPTVTVNAINGIATFNGLAITGAGSYQLVASAPGTTSATTVLFTVIGAGKASQLAITSQQIDTLTAGSAFGLTVEGLDGLGRLDTTFVGTVTLAILNNPAGGTLSGTLTAVAAGGIATFSGLSIDRAGTPYTLSLTSSPLTPGVSAPITVNAGHASQLVTQGPGDTAPATPFSMAVDAEDPLGNVDPTFAGNVTVAIGNNPGGSTLTGTLTQAASAGLASFTDLQLNQVGNGYTLTAMAAGLTTGTSQGFNVTTTPPRRPGVATDWNYLGRMNCPNNFTDGGNAYGSLALRKYPNLSKTFLILGHGDGIGGQFIWEMNIPGFSRTAPPRANIVQAWGNTLYVNNRVSSDPGKCSNNGLYWDVATSRLFILYGLTYDVGGGGAGDAPVIMFAQFDPVTGAYVGTYGPWLVDIGHSRVRSCMTSIPAWFRPFVAGRSIAIGGGTYSGSSTASWGFTSYAIDMPTPSTPPYVSAAQPGTTLKTTPMLFYPRLDSHNGYSQRYQSLPYITGLNATTGQPLLAPGTNQFPTPVGGLQPWTGSDNFRAMAFVSTGTIAGMVFPRSKPINFGWYGEPTIPGHVAACVGAAGKGQNAVAYTSEITTFAASDLQKVAQGLIPSYSPRANNFFNPQTQFGIQMNCYGLYTGMVFDQDTNILYGILNKVDQHAGSSTPGCVIDAWQLPA